MKVLDQADSPHRFHLKTGAFLWVSPEPKGASAVGLHFDEPKPDPEAIERALAGFRDAVAHRIPLCCKIIGSRDWVEALEKACLARHWKIVLREASEEESEIIFEPDTGRLRRAKTGGEKIEKKKIRVVIVDDSATLRKLLTQVLTQDPDIEVLAAVGLPSEAERVIAETKPDVVTLDIHMPEMNGVELLRRILARSPLPAVMISSLALEEGSLVLDALEAGAVDYIQKPSFENLKEAAPLIIEKIKSASKAQVLGPLAIRAQPKPTLKLDLDRLVVIGSSTGGTEALKSILLGLPEKIPPILIVQHIPPVFSKAFADRLNQICSFRVKEAEHQDAVVAGTVYVAAGGKQMRIIDRAGSLRIELDENAPPVNRHKPSVDTMFDSVCALGRRGIIGVILTGMGADGAKGLLRLREKGARTIAQDEASSVVFGMPKEAIRLGAAEKTASLDAIPNLLMDWLSTPERRR